MVDYSSQDVAEVYKEAPFDIAIDCMGTLSEWAPRGRTHLGGAGGAGGGCLIVGQAEDV